MPDPDQMERARLMGSVVHYRVTLNHIASDTQGYTDVYSVLLATAAEAINVGVDPAELQTMGVFTEIEIKQIKAFAAEFRQDDIEWTAEVAEAAEETPIDDDIS